MITEWSVVAPLIARALEHGSGTHTVEDVREAIAHGEMQLWPGERSVLVTEVVSYPRLRAVRVFCGAGDLKEIREMEKSVSAWAAAIGCQRVEGYGRIGWLKVLLSRGYSARVFMWKSVLN